MVKAQVFNAGMRFDVWACDCAGLAEITQGVRAARKKLLGPRPMVLITDKDGHPA
jgi:hypothetical protein